MLARVPMPGLDRARAVLTGLALITSLAACSHWSGASRYPDFHMSVDGLAAPEAANKRTYFLMPGLAGVRPDDLLFREFAHQARLALAFRGFASARSPTEADIVILLSYGIGEPRVEYQIISEPVWGMVPSGTSTTTVNTTTSTVGDYSYTSGTATTTQNQTVGVVGRRTYSQRTVEYDRYLQLTAIDVGRYKADGRLVEVWRTTVTSSGSSDDLRRVHPVMMAGAIRRLAKDTRGKERVSVTERHPRVQYIRGQLSAQQLAATGK